MKIWQEINLANQCLIQDWRIYIGEWVLAIFCKTAGTDDIPYIAGSVSALKCNSLSANSLYMLL